MFRTESGITLMRIGLVLTLIGTLFFIYTHLMTEDVHSSDIGMAFGLVIFNGFVFIGWIFILIGYFRIMGDSDNIDNETGSKISLFMWFGFYPALIVIGLMIWGIWALIEYVSSYALPISIPYVLMVAFLIWTNLSWGIWQYNIGGKNIQKGVLVSLLICLGVSIPLLFTDMNVRIWAALYPLEAGIVLSIILQIVSTFFVLEDLKNISTRKAIQ